MLHAAGCRARCADPEPWKTCNVHPPWSGCSGGRYCRAGAGSGSNLVSAAVLSPQRQPSAGAARRAHPSGYCPSGRPASQGTAAAPTVPPAPHLANEMMVQTRLPVPHLLLSKVAALGLQAACARGSARGCRGWHAAAGGGLMAPGCQRPCCQQAQLQGKLRGSYGMCGSVAGRCRVATTQRATPLLHFARAAPALPIPPAPQRAPVHVSEPPVARHRCLLARVLPVLQQLQVKVDFVVAPGATQQRGGSSSSKLPAVLQARACARQTQGARWAMQRQASAGMLQRTRLRRSNSRRSSAVSSAPCRSRNTPATNA